MTGIFRTLLSVLLFAVAAHGAVAEEIKLESGGLSLNANLEKVEGNWPLGPVVLITHGTLAHNAMEIISALQELFRENGYSSLALNLSLGLSDRHGMYDCATPHNHRHTDALDEIGLWLDWLKRQGVKKVVLLGHSRGGNQTAWFAAERDDPVITAVVLVAPQTWSEDYEARSYEESYNKPLAPVLGKAQELVKAGRPDAVMEHTDFIYCPDTSVTAATFADYYAPEPRMDTPALLPKIHKPVLVFAGTEDTVVKGLDKTLAPMAESGAIELVVMDGADHMFRDLYAEELVEKVVEFVGDD